MEMDRLNIHSGKGKMCEISDCPRCIVSQCEFSLLPKNNPNYKTPDTCYHRKFKNRKK